MGLSPKIPYIPLHNRGMADFMRRGRGKVMVSVNDNPGSRRLYDGFRFETMDICYCYSNQRQGKAELSGELVIMN